MPDETTNPYPEVPAMPDDAAMAAASAHAAEGYPSHGAAAATAVGWQRGWATGYAAGRKAEREQVAARLAVKALDFKVLAKHQFSSSRPWPDGSKPKGPDWNPGCSCGVSHYYFEHSRHLAEVVAEYLTGEQHDA